MTYIYINEIKDLLFVTENFSDISQTISYPISSRFENDDEKEHTLVRHTS